jgi:hypothetical protein
MHVVDPDVVRRARIIGESMAAVSHVSTRLYGTMDNRAALSSRCIASMTSSLIP